MFKISKESSENTMDWTVKQMMAVALSRQIEDGKTYIIGTGLPLIGATLAKNTYAPHAHFVFEAGLFEGSPSEVPTSVSDLRLNRNASVLWPQYRYFGFLTLGSQRGLIDAGFLGGAQIDPYGNLNSTCIGSYSKPETRFTGSGGANGIASFCDTIITMKHERRRFVEQVDYLTSPGWLGGSEGRKIAGLVPDKGPRAVITELGIMRFDAKSKRMYLHEYFQHTDIKTIQERTGFELDCSQAVPSKPPESNTLQILCTTVDPHHLMT